MQAQENPVSPFSRSPTATPTVRWHNFNPSTWEGEANLVCSEFQASQRYIVRHCLRINKKKPACLPWSTQLGLTGLTHSDSRSYCPVWRWDQMGTLKGKQAKWHMLFKKDLFIWFYVYECFAWKWVTSLPGASGGSEPPRGIWESNLGPFNHKCS